MTDTDVITGLKITLIVMAFYSFCITAVSYALPPDALASHYTTVFSDATTDYNMEDMSSKVSEGLTRQTNIPIIEMGALVFYSGNILIDLILNFAYAIPEMVGLLINGIQLLFSIDSHIFAMVEVFFAVIFTVLYVIGIIELLVGIRSGRVV